MCNACNPACVFWGARGLRWRANGCWNQRKDSQNICVLHPFPSGVLLPPIRPCPAHQNPLTAFHHTINYSTECSHQCPIGNPNPTTSLSLQSWVGKVTVGTNPLSSIRPRQPTQHDTLHKPFTLSSSVQAPSSVCSMRQPCTK
jgi:hypothetical protein